MRGFKVWTRLLLAAACAMVALAATAPSAGAFAQMCCFKFGPPGQMQISSDGRFVYVGDTYVTLALRRDAQTGALSYIDSYDGGGHGMTLSSDEKNLYVLDENYGRIDVFKRNPDNGALTEAGTWQRGEYGRITDIVARDATTLYAIDAYRDELMILDRNAATGKLSLRSEETDGAPGYGQSALELSPDGEWLYVHRDSASNWLSPYEVKPDGGLTAGVGFASSAYDDMVITPSGDRLISAPFGPSVFDRDAGTGALTHVDSPVFADSGYGKVDGAIALSPDASALYSIGPYAAAVTEYANGADGMTLKRHYYPGRDGYGLGAPAAIALSPDGKDLYVAGGGLRHPGTIADLRRNATTGELTYSSIVSGPYMTGSPPDQPFGPKITINGGAEFTNTPHVRVTVSGIGPADFYYEVSNDGGFGASERRFTNANFPWTLTSTGPEKLPKWVYLRALSGDARYSGKTLADDIVLDERPPAVDSAHVVPPAALRKAAATLRVRVKAHDNLSGVRRMQFRRGSTAGSWRAFKTLATAPAGKGKLYVRVRDGARNASAWRTVAG